MRKPNELQELMQDAFKILDRKDRRFLVWSLVFTCVFSILDLFAMGLVGLLGAISVTGVQSQQPTGKVQSALELFHIQNLNFQLQVGMLGAITIFALLLRTILSATLLRRVFKRLAQKGSEISSNLFVKVEKLDLGRIRQIGTVDIVQGVNAGVNSLVLGLVGMGISIAAESFLLSIVMLGLFIFDPVSALLILALLSAGITIMQFLLSKKTRVLSNLEAQLNIESDEDVREFVSGFREIRVYGASGHFAEKYSKRRVELSNIIAELTLLPNLTKYFVESAVILLVILFSAFQFLVHDAKHAIASLGVMLLISTRIVPSLLRIQQSSLMIKRSAAVARKTINLVGKLNEIQRSYSKLKSPEDLNGVHWRPNVCLSNVSYGYPDSNKLQLKNINLLIKEGEFLAIVGPSGAGKSTLVDLILGILEPTNGSVLISGTTPAAAIEKFRNEFAYVSQSTSILNSTILENITFNSNIELRHKENFAKAIESARLEDFIDSLAEGLSTKITTNEDMMSVGQRQRVGIARALFVKPSLLVMDEPTSALDAQTEGAIAKSIDNLRGKCTIVVIAHRLSTIVHADRILYMDNGEITHQGTFESLRASVPNFDEQARLLGL